jgi:hypothetical protein
MSKDWRKFVLINHTIHDFVMNHTVHGFAVNHMVHGFAIPR